MRPESDLMRTKQLRLGARIWRILRIRVLNGMSDPEMRNTMKDPATAVQCAAYHAASIARLQADAWAVWNASYDAPVPEAYRTVGLALYQQAVDQRIQTLFARSDEREEYQIFGMGVASPLYLSDVIAAVETRELGPHHASTGRHR